MDHSKNIYVIQGLFFQEKATYGIGQKPGIGEAVYQKDRLFYALFSGIIALSPAYKLGPLEGVLQDYYGTSTLTAISFSEETLEFTKKYDKRSDTVRYSFTKTNENVWLGSWEGKDTGSGLAKCIITTVDENFFQPKDIADFLKVNLE